MGRLCFIAQLLALSVIYGLWRGLTSMQEVTEPRVFSVLNNRTILTYALALGIVGMIARSFYQQDYWVEILGAIPVEVVHIPQYWNLFAIGIIAGRGQWLEVIPSSAEPKWLVTGLIAFGIALLTQPFLPLFPESALSDLAISLGRQWGILWGFWKLLFALALSLDFQFCFVIGFQCQTFG